VRILAQPEELSPDANGVCLALGVFDGVHLGHQAVIADMIREATDLGALPVVVTFDCHPNAVVAPHRTPALIQTVPQRLRALASLKPAAAWVIRFDEAFSRLSGAEFVNRLCRGFGRIRSVFVGEGFHFGHRRSGHVGLLRELGAASGFAVRALPPVPCLGAAVSSTRIRQVIRAGDLLTAASLLGRPYTLAGTVVRGEQLGRQWGFPTANLDTDGVVLPPNAVYVVRARSGERAWPGVMNVGSRPTVTNGPSVPRVEVHLLDTAVDLYGEELEVEPLHQLRVERKFPSVTELRDQIANDLVAARHWLEPRD
jgi:riboflavin kinase/FMN adenylyltransferase